MADSPSISLSSSSASEQTTSSSPSSSADAPSRTSSSPITTPDVPSHTWRSPGATTDSTVPYGPLITPFTAPAYCSLPVRECGMEGSSSCAPWTRDRTCGSDGKPTIASECFPPGTHWLGPYLSSHSAILYSPAFRCPEGWAERRRETLGFPGSTYTKVACCPSSYRPYALNSDPEVMKTCFSIAHRDVTTQLEVVCAEGKAPVTSTMTISDDNDFYASQIQFIFPRSECSTAPDGSSSCSTEGLPSPAPETTPSDPDSSSKSPLPKGAIAGIAVGFAILLLMAMCAPVWILHRRKQRQHSGTGTKKRIPFDLSSLPELVGIKGNGGSSAEMSLGHPNDVVSQGGGIASSSTPTAR